MAKKKKKFDINTLLIIALVAVSALGLYFTLSTPTPKAPEIPPAKQVSVTLLGMDCDGCFDVSVALQFLQEQQGINVTETKELTIEDSLDLAAEHNISRLPAVLITGETQNVTIQGFAVGAEALVFDGAPPPYYSVEDKKIKGKVDLILLDAGCEKCFNVSLVADQLQQIGLVYDDRKTVKADSAKGQELIEKYSIDSVPTMILSQDALEYQPVAEVWSQVGSEEDDGNLVLRFVSPPYINVSTGKTEGLVKGIFLKDETCEECYDVTETKELFEQGFGLVFGSDKTVDVDSAEGRKLVQSYDIELVPTVVFSKEVLLYPVVGELWEQLGSIEDDGMLIFREVPAMANALQADINYKNLTSGEMLSTAEPEEELEATVVEEAEITQPEDA